LRHPTSLCFVVAGLLGGLARPALAAAPEQAGALHGPLLGEVLPAWSALPFAGMLLSIALFPLLAPRLWHHHFAKISLFWGLLFALPFLWAFRVPAVRELLHVGLADYLPFVILLATLFTVGGGIVVRGTLLGTPGVNTALLAIGTLLASFIGTTGAAMVLIRPLLRANARRRHRAHTVIFFIFLVANIGGALTPLGDPPLFLGFLRGVPFFWTFQLWTEWLFVAACVLSLYFFLDSAFWLREDDEARRPAAGARQRLGLAGSHNFLLLGAVLGAVILSGIWHPGEVSLLGIHFGIQNLVRDALLLLALAVSWRMTSAELRKENGFSWFPIREVAILFAAIFATIVPLLAILRAGEQGALAPLIAAVQSPAQYFWASGLLSSVLDNAPTYLSFLSTALGRFYPGVPEREAILLLIESHGEFLKAVATGAVFMGANTYLGNAPNFMVKSIAEESGVEMPSFFGYVLRYTLPVLFPVFALATWIFF
jgi:Na+/H+ antiporter NhaD/arsenite permease-like protein